MKKTILLAILILASMTAWAQFDFGGGSSGPPKPAWSEFKLNPKTKVKLDFRNANVDNVVAFFTKVSGINIVKDPTLTGGITLTSAGPVTLNSAFEILSATLSLRNFELKKEGSLLVIRAKQQRGGGSGMSGFMEGMTPEQMQSMFGGRSELKVYPIEFANASAVARVINDVFATATDPMTQFMQQMGMMGNTGMGGNTGRPGQNNQGGRNNGGMGGRFNRGGFGGFGGNQPSVRASSDDFSNSVIVNAPSQQQQQVLDLIKKIDKQTEAPLSPKVYRLKYAVADEISAAVQNVLTANAPKGRGGVGTQNVPIEQRFQQAMRLGSFQAAFGTVVTDARTNSLIVTATEDNQKLVDTVVKELDTEVTYQDTTFVFPLSNARADQISSLLSQAFGQRQGANNRNTQTQRAQNTRFPTNNQNRPNTGGGGNTGGGIRLPQSNSASELELALEDPQANSGDLETEVTYAQGGGFGQMFGGQRRPTTTSQTSRDENGRLVNVRDLSGQITVIPDPNTNSLIVVTSPDNLTLIKQILDQLDRIPEQVMIETIIVEATLDSSTKLGMEWSYVTGKLLGEQGTGGTAGTAFGLQNATPSLQGFRFTVTGSKLTGFMNALQTDRRFNVLSTPRIFTSNNSEAQINISQRVPYVVSQREDPNGNLTFNYAFQDVGIVLTVTPRITSNGYVTMDIVQTANDLEGFTTFNAPIVNQRQADTTVSVKDGETIVLGGIIRTTVNSTTRKIPLIGDIPILGNLFRSTDKSNVKTELMVFLTPRVVRNEEEARKLRESQQGQLSPGASKNLPKAEPTAPSAEPAKPKTGG